MDQLYPDRSLRQTAFPYVVAIAVSIAIAALLVAAVSMILAAMREDDLQESRLINAESWAEHFVSQTPDIPSLMASSTPTQHQMHGIEMAESFDHVDGFAILASDGSMLFQTEHFEWLPDADKQQIVPDVVTSGEGQVFDISELKHHSHSEILAMIVVPLMLTDGKTVGALAILKHEKTAASEGYSTSDMLSLIMPVISAVVFLAPMLLAIHSFESARRRAQEVSRLSTFDPLTGALNRSSFGRHLDRCFEQRRHQTDLVGIIHIDMDNFKSINDQFGHDKGDAFLRAMTSRFLDVLPKSGFLGRLGGDEFVICLPHTTREELRKTSHAILTAAATAVRQEEHSILATVSIGMHLAPLEQDLETALANADLAMDQAKENGRNQIVEYVPALNVANTRGKLIEATLRRALDDNLLELFYQAIVDGHDNRIIGFEALLRLKDGDEGYFGPDEFIPVAERTGLINAIGRWTLSQAMQKATTWDDDIFISVNLSPVQLQSETLAQEIIAMLTEIGLRPDRLELEMTESMLLSDELGVSAQIEQLRFFGVRIAMDDFGTGYSSLGYLWKYDFDKIKIDRSFLQGYENSGARYRDIIETIVLLGHKLDMKVTVEGVETLGQTQMLSSMNADQFQGYYFSRPVPADQADALIARSKTIPMDLSTAV